MAWNKSTTINKSNGALRDEQAQRGEDRAMAYKSRTQNYRHPEREPAQTVDDLAEKAATYVYVPKE